MRTKIIIIGGGPAGLLLSQLLMKSGIDTVILEKQSRQYVLGRIRAGVLEPNSVNLLKEAGVGKRIGKEGFTHSGTTITYGNETIRINLKKFTNINTYPFNFYNFLYNAHKKCIKFI